MLGIDHQHGRYEGHQPGADPSVLGGQWRSAVCGAAARRDVRLGVEDAGSAPVRELGQTRQGASAAIRRSDDGFEPSSSRALDCTPTPHRAGESSNLPARQIRQAIHGVRRGPAGLRRPGAREFERTGDTTDSGTGIQRLRSSSVCTAVVHLGGAPLPANPRITKGNCSSIDSSTGISHNSEICGVAATISHCLTWSTALM